MPVATESRIIEKIQEILDEQRLETNDLATVSRIIRQSRNNPKIVMPHSVHLTTADARGKQLHLRVLIWKSEKWRKERLECIESHRRLATSTQRTERAFRVPKMVRHGESPLLWDLTEHVNAVTLPWLFPGKLKLHDHLRRVPAFFDIAEDLEKIRISSAPERDWATFAKELEAWPMWAYHTGIVNSEVRDRLLEVTDNFDSLRFKPVLTHADYGPNNVMFPVRGKPWLIDFDHIKYSLPGDSLASHLHKSYFEKSWNDRVFTMALRRIEEKRQPHFVTAFSWHTMNLWRVMFREWAPVRNVRNLDALEKLMPRTKFHVTRQRLLLQRVLDSFALLK